MTLESLDLKIKNSIDILKQYEPKDGYWVAFSGGKDSIVIYDLVKKSGVKHEVHFNQTTIDPPEIYKFINDNYPETIWEIPKRSMFAAIRARQVPPTRMRRYCCAELKELHGIGRVVVTGVRREESNSRKDRPVYGESHYNENTIYCNPIVDWTLQDVWDYIRANNLKYPSLYNDGYDRIGCIMCPLQNRYGMLKDAIRYPKHYNAYLLAFEEMLYNCKMKHVGCKTELKWKSPEDVMFWWIYGIHRKDCKKEHWKLPNEPGFDLESIKPRSRRKTIG
jgi:phosphoadenosine phosphosulfate reductase